MWWLFLLALSASAQQLAGVIGAAAITGVTAWFVARRGSSGRVETSDARTLFDTIWKLVENQDQRIKNQDQRIADQQGEIKQHLERIAVLEAEQAQYKGCRERVAVLEALVARMEEREQ